MRMKVQKEEERRGEIVPALSPFLEIDSDFELTIGEFELVVLVAVAIILNLQSAPWRQAREQGRRKGMERIPHWWDHR